MIAWGSKVAWFLAAVVLATAPALRARANADGWVLLHSAAVETKGGVQVLALPDSTPRTLAIRLSAKRGPVSLSRVVVTYVNGQIHFENWPGKETIRPGKPTKPIDQREEARIVDTVALSFEPAPSSGQVSTIEVWGLSEVGASPSKSPGTRGEPTGPGPNHRYVEVPVFFGTTRQQETDRVKNDRKLATFSGEQAKGSDLTLGRAIVTVPIERDPGTIPRPPEFDLFIAHIAFRKEDPNRDFTIAAVDVMPKDTFVDEARKQVALSTRYKDQAFVFVHGYNVSFDDAIFRTAQIAHDIAFDGPAFAFSWPSRGGMLDYRYDMDTAKASRHGLRQLLELVARDAGVNAINLVAHSMGNDPVMEVLRDQAEIIARHGTVADFKLNEIVLAAPDISREVFEQFAAQFVSLAKGGVTLYASKTDRALAMSKSIARGLVRAGDVPEGGIVIVPGVESIDISDASTGFFSTNHSTFAERRHLIKDMRLLFERSNGKHPPDMRFPVYQPQDSQLGKWWRYQPN